MQITGISGSGNKSRKQKMKKIILMLLVLFSVMLAAAERKSAISGKKEKITAFEIVVEQKTPLLNYAANELLNFLHKATGIKGKIVAKPSGEIFAFVLGDSALSRTAGINVSTLPAEGYVILRKGNLLFLAGRDDPKASPKQNHYWQTYKRGTLSAVYDFLERFVGIRFYFPGPMGTIIPKNNGVCLPEKISVTEAPDMDQRIFYQGNTREYPGYNSPDGVKGNPLTRSRLRFSEVNNFYAHGINALDYINRFGKTHPEYFALMPDGKRYCDPRLKHTGQLCLSSGIREIIYQDAKAYLLNRPASERGLKRWKFKTPGLINLNPQDAFYWCGCEKCRKIAPVGREVIYRDPVYARKVSDFLWKFAAEIGFRLKKEGVPGKISFSVYPPKYYLPSFELPDNLYVFICTNGQGADDAEIKKLKTWSQKIGGRPVVMTYALGKHMQKAIPGIPPMMPHGIGRFIDANKACFDGGLFESESDTFISQYLNYYVLSKKLWDNSADIEKILDEHYLLMFGKGAPMMKKIYESLEYLWVEKILGKPKFGALGPKNAVPDEQQLWTQLYSPERMAEYLKLVKMAAAAAKDDKDAVRRIEFIRRHLLGPIEVETEKYRASQTARDSWFVSCPGTVWLRPRSGEFNEVSTKVSVKKDASNLLVTFDCEEPFMDKLAANQTKRDQAEIALDSSVEFMINPSGDRKNYYHFIANANGVIADFKVQYGKRGDKTWNSSATASAAKRKDGWSVTIRIPLKELGELNEQAMPVNFCRNRVLKGIVPKEPRYHWTPFSGKLNGFHVIPNWGVLRLKPQTDEKVVFHYDFSDETPLYTYRKCLKNENDKGKMIAERDSKVFISGGKSLHLKNVKGNLLNVAIFPGKIGQKIRKPSTRYRLSCFIKTLNITGDAGAALSFRADGVRCSVPRRRLSGTHPWHRLSVEFTTPEKFDPQIRQSLIFWLQLAEGEVWFDEIKIEELP